MATLDVHNISGAVLREKELAEAFTDAEVNGPVIHQCVVAYLANQRQGTASTKTRSEVKGSGRKLYRQKGTGRARVGDAKSPIRVHGGVAFGPKPRSYRQATPKRLRQLGLHSALADRFQNQQCILVEDFTLEHPRTKDIVKMLEAVNAEGKVLFVLNEHSLNIHLSVRNIPQVNSCTWDNINIYQVMWHDTLIITENAAEKLESKFVSISSDKEG
ncbi:50S ribosomal protein L4 [Geodia barretti]|jgi:large subunit ribosomal protein L4|uniref:Large ribosomal subunit protein uL4m n=1 Tax=Geodia barretti TaxID=519541 RepID=A0AA35SBV8_GEOBA|nr:50S ribosomal protein L4 [Geodia barretti]